MEHAQQMKQAGNRDVRVFRWQAVVCCHVGVHRRSAIVHTGSGSSPTLQIRIKQRAWLLLLHLISTCLAWQQFILIIMLSSSA